MCGSNFTPPTVNIVALGFVDKVSKWSDDGTEISVTGNSPNRSHGSGSILWDGNILTSDTYDAAGNSYSFDISQGGDVGAWMNNGGTLNFASGGYYGSGFGEKIFNVAIQFYNKEFSQKRIDQQKLFNPISTADDTFTEVNIFLDIVERIDDVIS